MVFLYVDVTAASEPRSWMVMFETAVWTGGSRREGQSFSFKSVWCSATRLL